MSSKKYWWVFPLIFVVGILADQMLKFYVKLNFTLGEDYEIFSWFHLVFVENPGMAFGVTLGSKLILTIFRVVVSGALIWWMVRLIRRNFDFGFLVVLALVLTGAVGNIIDCLFYGMMFTESGVVEVAQMVCDGGAGYAGFGVGKVVDMFYFPLFEFPQWMPLFGGEIFFSPVFNLADSYITVSIFLIILFYRKSFNKALE
ncbi:MAG: lipoprotein signal peptidase [Paludibacteraceae bacterium]|nr:lipoprotein signal peptidase [Paludibacteraceae bacterium]